MPNQFVLPLQVDRGTNRTQLVGREDPFTEQEMVLVRRLHRLLGVLDGQLSAFGAWSRGVRPQPSTSPSRCTSPRASSPFSACSAGA